ncbi:BCN_G0017930.mRNA.1.CDS.1 [Saccharomyces cerevisiae]|nr:BCN_G0017930.mRNA.1.CDS.1 [Saccharomyces cerevisiae]CAI4535128.1 BCE_3a_G0017820.mRNA.1.CDS.1 [Saccharomyces cerevisiae]CAI7158413.1 BCN_G0017930.mRNA.1.CDS.1 [Saccharomyces cerevisiae]CAI7160362.1 BCE_3a_G0017820.mRNA.1.CDS.1 [Saccharomyces cerevisiae]
MLNRFNKFQAALALALYSQSVLGQYYPNSTTVPSNSSSSAFSSTSSNSFSISSSITQSTSSAPDVSSSLTQLTSSSELPSSIAPSSSSGSEISSSNTQSASTSTGPSGTGSTGSVSSSTSPSGADSTATGPSGTGSTATGPSGADSSSTSPSGISPSGSGSTTTSPSGTGPSGSGSTATSPSGTGSTATGPSGTGPSGTGPSGTSLPGTGSTASGSSASITQSASSAPSLSSSIPQSTSSVSTVSGSITSGTLSSITPSASSATATATASNSLSSSDATIYLPSTTISGDVTLTGSVIATEAVEVAAGGRLTLLDGDKYVFSADLIVYGGVFVEKSKPTYPGTEFDITGENFDVSGTFDAEEPAATSASIYSFTPGSFINSGGITLSLPASTKGRVTFSPYSNSGTLSFSNSILSGGSVSGLQRRAAAAGSVNNGEINLDNGSTYVIVEPVSGSGTINIISGNLYLHYPGTFTGQTVVFKGEGVLAVDPTESNTTPIPVVGYTGKNQIAITADVTNLSYDSNSGVLTATQGNSQFSFSIGTGFSSSGFNW